MKPVSESFTYRRYIIRVLLICSVFVSWVPASADIFTGGDVAKGEALFKANCASCHRVSSQVLAAPGLAGIQERWKGKDALLVKWIQDPKAAHATGDAYVKSIVDQYVPTFGWMQPQPVTEAEVKDILTYVMEGGGEPQPTKDPGNKCLTLDEVNAQREFGSDNSTMIWLIIVGILIAIVGVSAANISKSLKNAINEREGKELEPTYSYWHAVKRWMWANRVFVSLVGLFIFCWLTVVGYDALMDIGVYEGYQPEQPILFSHAIHVCQNEIDCQYCHNTAAESRHAGIPSATVCMNCHKGVQQGTQTGTGEISKIYSAIGFDPATGTYKQNYPEQPIEWVKVHNLPDHVYFPHSTHVSVAKLDCKQCHGPVQMFGVGRQATIDEINSQTDVPGLIKLTKPTLTMGWCIECHNKAEIDLASSEYYITLHERMKETDLGLSKLREISEDDAVTVREMGGWECGKCHY